MVIKISAKKPLVNVLITGISILLLLVSLEFILRAYHYLKNAKNEICFIPGYRISDKAFNIYYFGGSTMFGEPYFDTLSIPKLVSYMLDYRVQDKDIRYINMAERGRDFQYALQRLKLVLKKKDITHPSLCVIYSGHNEFLKYHDGYGFGNSSIKHNKIKGCVLGHSYLIKMIMNKIMPKSYNLEIDERNFFDHLPYGISEKKEVIDKYRSEIIEAIELLYKYNVPCVISTVAGNYADWEPNRSVFCGNDADKIEFRQLMDSGNKAQVKEIYVEAITYYLKALSLCDSFAETHYQLGKCYEMLGDYGKAWQEYQKAVNYDGMPLRATEEQNNFIKAIPEDNVMFTVDAVKCLRENAEHRLIGFNLMIDGHHPNLKGYILISQLIAEKIEKIFHETKQIRALSEEDAEDKFSINQSKVFEIYISRGRWLTRIATWRYAPLERLERAELYFFRAMTIDGSRYEPYLGLSMCSFLRKNTFQAEKYLSQARAINPKEVNKYLKEFWIYQIIKRAYQ